MSNEYKENNNNSLEFEDRETKPTVDTMKLLLNETNQKWIQCQRQNKCLNEKIMNFEKMERELKSQYNVIND